MIQRDRQTLNILGIPWFDNMKNEYSAKCEDIVDRIVKHSDS